MKKEPVRISIFPKEEDSWDTIWKWSWFTKELWISQLWKEEKIALRSLFSLLPKLQIKSILDCACGLGFKTMLFAKMGYEVEGSDASAIAIKYARQLEKGEGVNIKFFRSRYEELVKKCRRKYDCVYSDNFDEIRTRRTLRTSAKGIYSVLNKDGKFIFGSLNPKYTTKSDLKKLIEKEWKKRKRFEILPPYEKEGVRVTSLEVAEKTSEGIIENRIFLIEEQGVMRAEIASIMNPRIKLTFQNYVEVLREVGFRKVDCIKREGTVFNIGVK